MERLIYPIWMFFLVSLVVSCTHESDIWNDTGRGSIKLRFADGLLVSRAADTEAERAISHLDVFIFKNDGTDPIYERINNPSVSGEDNEGTVTLNAELSQFEDRPSNLVYVIANATENFTGSETLETLQQKIQTDERIHVTGTAADGAPQYFLMDGQAASVADGTSGLISIKHDSREDVMLYVTMKRAAAKVVVTLSQGEEGYKFLQDATRNYERGYYFRNMPYKTKLLDVEEVPYPSESYLRIPDKANDSAFEWGTEQVVVTAYIYSHYWSNGDLEASNYHSEGTSLVVNIPLWHDENDNGAIDEDEDVYENSYYQIPVVSGINQNGVDRWFIGRNTLYTVEATINAPGAEDNKQPHTLENLTYQTKEWEDVDINVGGVVSPKYLKVNKNLLEMHNVAADNTLEFVSSSPITSIEISNAYYINKYGNNMDVTDYETNGMSTSYDKGALTGTIAVNSNIPTNFTARYFTLTVTNEDGETETIDVVQYPVICVTNQLSWYSYRDDFENSSGRVMTYQDYYEGGYVNVSATNDNGRWTGLNYGTDSNGGFFASKVRGDANDDGTYKNLRYYYEKPRKGQGKLETSTTEGSANIRMYRIDVRATSGEYVVGRPRITDGVTDPDLDNQRMVSPSFMIASRLAVITTSAGGLSSLDNGCSEGVNGGVRYDKRSQSVVTVSASYSDNVASYKDETNAYNDGDDELLKVYADHCKKYVEVASDGRIYNDWRLPTAAEIQFIIDTQGKKGEDSAAIDYLLNGLFYYSAYGPVYNRLAGSSGKTIRCVRDVY